MTTLYAVILIVTRFALAAAANPGSDAAAQASCSSVQSAILGRAVDYCVALPPGFDSSGATRYPTLYFLHGLFEDDRSWSERGGERLWEDLTARGEIGKFIVVLPDAGKTFYVNSLDGRDRYEDFFIQELVPAIDRAYPTLAEPAARGVTGTSMGGYGALHYGMRHPNVFGSASAHSAALLPKFPNPIPTEGRWGFYARILQGPFGSPLNEAYWEANSPLTLAEHPEHFAGLKLYFDCGDQDRYGFEEGAKLLDQVLTAHGFPHDSAIRPGGHGWNYLLQYMPYSLKFHWQYFHKAEENRQGKPENPK